MKTFFIVLVALLALLMPQECKAKPQLAYDWFHARRQIGYSKENKEKARMGPYTYGGIDWRSRLESTQNMDGLVEELMKDEELMKLLLTDENEEKTEGSGGAGLFEHFM